MNNIDIMINPLAKELKEILIKWFEKNPYDYEYERNLRRLVQKCCNLEEY